jgi:type VI secretion system secreted protein VgrG
MWAVLYDDGTSLTTVSEPIAHALAEAERQRGHHVTVRRLDDDADSVPESEPIRPAGRWARPGPISEPEPVLEPEPTPAAEPTPAPEPTQFSGPAQAVEPTQTGEPASVPGPASEASRPVPAREPEPARAARPRRRRRLLLYALIAVSILVAAALTDHWDVLPRVGATTSSSPTQVSGPPYRPQLLPPLNQPPVMHFTSAVRARPTPRPQSAMGESSAGGRSANARGG